MIHLVSANATDTDCVIFAFYVGLFRAHNSTVPAECKQNTIIKRMMVVFKMMAILLEQNMWLSCVLNAG